jgi:hypothetical protein
MVRARLVFAMAFLSAVYRNGEMAVEALANAFQQLCGSMHVTRYCDDVLLAQKS